MDLPIDELRMRTALAVELVENVRTLLARYDQVRVMEGQPGGDQATGAGAPSDAEPGGAAPGILVDPTTEEVSADVADLLARSVGQVTALVPGVMQLVMERRDEVEQWRAHLAEVRASIDDYEDEARVEVERGEIVLRSYDALAGLLDEIQERRRAIYRRMGVNSIPPDMDEEN